MLEGLITGHHIELGELMFWSNRAQRTYMFSRSLIKLNSGLEQLLRSCFKQEQNGTEETAC